MGESVREFFGLEEYSEEAVDKVVAMQSAGGISVQDIAEEVGISVDAVNDIISSTFQVWGH